VDVAAQAKRTAFTTLLDDAFARMPGLVSGMTGHSVAADFSVGVPGGLDQGPFGAREMDGRGEPGRRVTVGVGFAEAAEGVAGAAVGLCGECRGQICGRPESRTAQ
jgi:hypothetical protein